MLSSTKLKTERPLLHTVYINLSRHGAYTLRSDICLLFISLLVVSNRTAVDFRVLKPLWKSNLYIFAVRSRGYRSLIAIIE